MPRHFSRATDHLGWIGNKLRDLQGFATLAYELIQNADDAHKATEVSFDVREKELVVDNDGVFRDCGRIEDSECPWKESKGHRCDLHRFRIIASGDKREEPDATGAFGIGFIAVYQITDYPELISAGQHWRIQEDAPETERILACDGCSVCQSASLPGTRFIFPWVRDGQSVIRRGLRAQPVPEDICSLLREDLQESLPIATPFLKKLRVIVLKREGKPIARISCEASGNKLLISDGSHSDRWLVLKGNFEPRANQLKVQFANQIEPKRPAFLAIGIPYVSSNAARLFATLPTKRTTALEFHVNANFYPSNDRKGITLEGDYQSIWNRVAIEASAAVLAENIEGIGRQLGHKRLWEIIQSTWRTSNLVGGKQEDVSFAAYWKELRSALKEKQIVFTVQNQWVKPTDALLLEKEGENEAIALLKALGLPVIHEDLRPFFSLLQGKEVGVPLLKISHLVAVLRGLGLTKRTPITSLPPYLQKPSALQILHRELEMLLSRCRSEEVLENAQSELKSCALVFGRDGALWPCETIYRAENATADLFSKLSVGVEFLGPETRSIVIGNLCPQFDAATAVKTLSTALSRGIKLKADLIPALLEWFESCREDIRRSSATKAGLAKLPIFPTSDGLRPLESLVLPGDFTDPLGLVPLADEVHSRVSRVFLRELGVKELTFPLYVANHLPKAFANGSPSPAITRKIVHLLADRLGEIRDDFDAQESLSELPVVECADGTFREAADTYLELGDLGEIFENSKLALLPETQRDAVKELFLWLGVVTLPRYSDLIERVTWLVATPPNSRSIELIRKLFAHLGKRTATEPINEPELTQLRKLAWLPGRHHDTRWFPPNEIFAAFQDYLFETQAVFLDIGRQVQNESAELIKKLGIKHLPSVHQVVEHLMTCSNESLPVNNAVYKWLNDLGDADIASFTRLRHAKCLFLPTQVYVRPDQVFWGEHQFGHFRHRLGSDMRAYSRLLERIGVRDEPDYNDAIRVVQEIEEIYAPENAIVEELDQKILMSCWQFLADELSKSQLEEVERSDIQESIGTSLSSRKVVLDRRGMLCPPKWMLFEDRPGIAEKFRGSIGSNIIPRPQKAWRVMALAGVRDLSDAVRSNLVECQYPAEDEFVANRIQERRREIMRVLEVQTKEYDESIDETIIDQLNCVTAREILVQYSMEGYANIAPSEPESVKAHYHRESKTLYSQAAEGTVPPWTAIARELAIAFFPRHEPGNLASGIKEVLAADDADAANAVLNELGYSVAVEAVETKVINDGGTIQGFGGIDVTGESPTKPPQESIEGDSSPEPHTSDDSGEKDEVEDEEHSIQTPEEAIASILDPTAASPNPPPFELDRPDSPSPGRGSASQGNGKDGKKAAPGSARKKPATTAKLRTYVTHNADDESGPDRNNANRGRSPVDEAGVLFVMDSEQMLGRNPEQMPQTHPGYDIKSCDDRGRVVRYIEVKSLAGAWTLSGAAMTDRQFEEARTHGNKFWLYVVEHATSDEPQLHRIQDPARKVNQFIFDDGWKVLAEGMVEEFVQYEGSD